MSKPDPLSPLNGGIPQKPFWHPPLSSSWLRLILDDEVDIGDSVGKNVCSAVPKWIQPIQSFDMEAIFQLPDIGAIYLADYFSSAFFCFLFSFDNIFQLIDIEQDQNSKVDGMTYQNGKRMRLIGLEYHFLDYGIFLHW